jgi:hypothetical protein
MDCEDDGERRRKSAADFTDAVDPRHPRQTKIDHDDVRRNATHLTKGIFHRAVRTGAREAWKTADEGGQSFPQAAFILDHHHPRR